MIIEISIAIAVFIFAILAFFIIHTLFALQRTLRGIDRINAEIIEKFNHLDSTLETISNLGEISKLETDKMKLAYCLRQNALPAESCSNDLANWVLASIKLGSKLLKRRQSNEP